VVSTLEEISEDISSSNSSSSKKQATSSPPLLHKILLPFDSHGVLHREGDEGGGQVAGEGKAERVKLRRVEDGKDLPSGGGHPDGVVSLVAAFLTDCIILSSITE